MLTQAIRSAVVVMAAVSITAGLAGCAPSEATTPEQRYVADVHTALPETIGTDDAKTLDLGRSICHSFDSGANYDQVETASSALTPKQVYAIASSAVTNLCPSNAPLLRP